MSCSSSVAQSVQSPDVAMQQMEHVLSEALFCLTQQYLQQIDACIYGMQGAIIRYQHILVQQNGDAGTLAQKKHIKFHAGSNSLNVL